MDSKSFKELVTTEHQHYVDHGVAHPDHEPFDRDMAIQRALTRVALSTFTDEELDYFKSLPGRDDSRYIRDAIDGTYEDKIYLTDYVKTLTEPQLAQVITYYALRSLRPLGTRPQEFIMVYDDEAGGFMLTPLPLSSSIDYIGNPLLNRIGNLNNNTTY